MAADPVLHEGSSAFHDDDSSASDSGFDSDGVVSPRQRHCAAPAAAAVTAAPRSRKATSSSASASSQQRGGDKDGDNQPAFSRIFVVCNKSTTEDELRALFSPFGPIEYCRLLRDRDTHVSKGLCYIKYPRASCAAAAIEQLDGTHVSEHLPPLKVQIAEAKGSRKSTRKQYTDEPEDTPPRSRLFVVCPRDLSEAQLTHEFARFGNLEYCKVMTDRQSSESKGYCYVKFKLASTAAFAMETINETGRLDGRKVKVLIADPKAKRASDEITHTALSPDGTDGLMYGSPYLNAAPLYLSPPTYPTTTFYPSGPYDLPTYFAPHPPASVLPTTLVLICNPAVTQEMLDEFLSCNPLSGLEFCVLQGPGNALLGFGHPVAASMALSALYRAELGGSPITVGWLEMPEAMAPHHMMPPVDPYLAYPPLMLPPIGAMLPPYAYAPGHMSPPSIAPQKITHYAPLMAMPPAAIPYNRDPAARPDDTTAGSNKLLFSLAYRVGSPILRDIFSRFGTIKSLEYDDDRQQLSGFVLFDSPAAALRAFTLLADIQINGETVALNLAFDAAPARVLQERSASCSDAAAAADERVVPIAHEAECVQ